VTRDAKEPEDRRLAVVLDLFPKPPPSVLIGIVRSLVPAEPGAPRPDDNPPPRAA
jgi:hypothetical protein